MKRSHFVAIRNQASDNTLELYFLDVIQDNYDFWSGMQTSKVQEIIDKVNFYQPAKIVCYIDSIGGDAQCGMSIYNFLKLTTAKVEVRIIGIAASIAAIIAMAANKGKLYIARNAFMMIHQAEGMAWGTPEEIRQAADVVELYTGQCADILAQRTGKTKDEVLALWASGDYWMTGEEAVQQAFADEMFNNEANVNVAARLDTAEMEKVPTRIRALLKPSQGDDPSNKILDEMKKLGERIMNALGLHKPAKPEDSAILNQVGTIMQPVLDEFSGEVDTTITNRVNEAMASPAVNGAIATQVTNAIASIDFAADGPARTAMQTAVTNMITGAFKPDGNAEVRGAVQGMIDAATTELKTKNQQLENEITAMKGKPLNSGNRETDDVPAARGKMVK